MNDYKEYLEKKGYANSTVIRYEKEIKSFIKWCKRNHTSPDTIDYKNCMKYIKYLQRKKVSKRTVNHSLGYLKSYLTYLVATDHRAENPIEDTIIRGVQRDINYTLLEPEELEDLYYSYQSDNITNNYQYYTAKRNKIIVGFMVYQGLKTEDLKSLKQEHLQIHKGKIYVPSRKKSNARELELKPWQMMSCLEYQNEIREVLAQRLKDYEDREELFPYTDRFTMIPTIMKQLKRYNQKVSSTKQIRASVITNWLSQYNLRKVQYLAGHRYISSTERYLQDDLENLHEIVNNYHPIH